jgi:hypothetical protein
VATTERFVYVARHGLGNEVPLRHLLEHLPEEALQEAGIREFASYVGSGYCVLQFTLPPGDAQEQFQRLFNEPRLHDFFRRLAGFLEEGEQIGRFFTAGDRFHSTPVAGSGESVTSALLPLAAEASHWPKDLTRPPH